MSTSRLGCFVGGLLLDGKHAVVEDDDAEVGLVGNVDGGRREVDGGCSPVVGESAGDEPVHHRGHAVLAMLRFSVSMMALTLGSTLKRHRAPSKDRCQKTCSDSVRAFSKMVASSPGRRVPTSQSLRPAPAVETISSEWVNTVLATRVA